MGKAKAADRGQLEDERAGGGRRAWRRIVAGGPGRPEDKLICPPATLLAPFAAEVAGAPSIAGLGCHAEPCGAFTGESLPMLADLGGRAVIVGHSERRAEHSERDGGYGQGRGGLAAWADRDRLSGGERGRARSGGLRLVVVARQLGGRSGPCRCSQHGRGL